MRVVLLIFLAAMWLMGAWEQELIGAWGAWTSIGLALVALIVAAPYISRSEGNDD